VRIHVVLKPSRRGDVDNIAKPILDALGELLGSDSWGRANDDRVWDLRVTKESSDEKDESVRIEIHRIDALVA